MTSVEFALRTWNESNQRGHWAAQRKRRGPQRLVTRTFAHANLTRPELPCVVLLIRIAPRELDCDGVVSALKQVRDGVADWLEIDDRDKRVTWRYAQQKRSSYGVRIEVSG
jgi:hypothetical protein